MQSNPEGTPSLLTFLASTRRNSWLHGSKIDVYVRKGKHSLENRIVDCLDIANINVEEEFQGRGIFKSWLQYTEDAAHKFNLKAVFVENILNHRLAAYLSRIGYKRQTGVDISMYKFVGVNHEL
jgi:GNAT superfamily N-acetyltransferase